MGVVHWCFSNLIFVEFSMMCFLISLSFVRWFTCPLSAVLCASSILLRIDLNAWISRLLGLAVVVEYTSPPVFRSVLRLSYPLVAGVVEAGLLSCRMAWVDLRSSLLNTGTYAHVYQFSSISSSRFYRFSLYLHVDIRINFNFALNFFRFVNESYNWKYEILIIDTI